MQLEITDQFNDVLLVSNLQEGEHLFISCQDTQTGNISNVDIKKDQAQQIIAHLQEQFSLTP